MGIIFVLLLWAIIGLIVASTGGAIFGVVTAFFTRRITTGRRRMITAAAVFPFLCLGWGGVVFVVQAVVNETLLDRDMGLGDTWHAPLPNGYQILMIDVTDVGSVYNPKTQPSGVITNRNDAVFGVRQLQFANRYIAGAADSNSFQHLGTQNGQVDSYFVLDIKLGEHMSFQDRGDFQKRCKALGIEPQLEPIATVYGRYRFTSFDIVTAVFFVLPPLAAAILLVVWIVRQLRASPSAGSGLQHPLK